MKLTRPLLFCSCLIMFSCSSSIPPPNGMVDWLLANGTGSSVTIEVYDKICRRTYYRIRLTRSGQASMTTCADSEGWADVRYRRAGKPSDFDNPRIDSRVSPNQSLIVR